MNEPMIDSISPAEFEQAVQAHIVWATRWDGMVGAEDFFGLWAALHHPQAPLQLKAQIVEGRLEITAPAEGPVQAINNHIYLENGLELVISLA